NAAPRTSRVASRRPTRPFPSVRFFQETVDMKKPSAHQHRRTALKGISGLAVAPALIGSARAQGRVRWKLQSHLPKSSVSFQGSLGVLADELEKRTDGRFTLELLGAGELAK